MDRSNFIASLLLIFGIGLALFSSDQIYGYFSQETVQIQTEDIVDKIIRVPKQVVVKRDDSNSAAEEIAFEKKGNLEQEIPETLERKISERLEQEKIVEKPVLSGLSTVLHQLARRTRENRQPMPNAFIHRDEENRLTLARLVPIDDQYFTILAILHGNVIGPDALDPLVPVIRKVLRYEPWAA